MAKKIKAARSTLAKLTSPQDKAEEVRRLNAVSANPALAKAARFLLDEVLRPFMESSLYDDYKGPDDAQGFTDEQYEAALAELEKVATPVTGRANGHPKGCSCDQCLHWDEKVGWGGRGPVGHPGVSAK